MIYMDECTVERGNNHWLLTHEFEGTVVASVPFELAADEEDAALILEQVIKGHNKGVERGMTIGRRNLQDELRVLLNAAAQEPLS